MKTFNLKKMKQVLLCGVLGLTALLCTAFAVSFTGVKASAASLTASQYQTDGASIRIFKKDDAGELVDVESGRTGMRFHVEMGNGYAYNGTTLIDTAAKNDNESFKLASGFKTYTLILPTRILGNNDLTVETDKVMKLDTSKYWYSDADGNLESVAYVYSVPANRIADTFAFRGVICTVAADGTETVVASTDVTTRQLCFVAKEAYEDTLDTSYEYWGKGEAFDTDAAEKIKQFIPTYTITYDKGNDASETEEVLWGDTPKSVPDVTLPELSEHIDYSASWYNVAASKEVDVTKAMTYDESCAITLTHATATEFTLTGVADYGDNGIKVYATLPAGDFANGTAMDINAVKVDYTPASDGKFTGLTGVKVLQEGSDAYPQMRLVFEFDSSTMKNGDKLTIKGDSVFYANNIMYKLTEDYVIDYTCNEAGEESYGMFLGYLYSSDIFNTINWIETTDASRKRIRITFYNDLLVNDTFTFVFDGTLPTGYAYPVYTYDQNSKETQQITGGQYYWNNGQHTILELEGHASNSQVELHIAPGTKIVQNGGYYIFEDAMYAYYYENDEKLWTVGEEKGTFGADAFEWKGWNATDVTEARFTTNSNTSLVAGGTTDRWFEQVTPMTVEHMSKSTAVPYAVYCTYPDGTVQEIEQFMFHGQTTDKGYEHVLGFKGVEGTQAGQVITVVSGTRFWYGKDYFTASTNISFYYNGTYWVANHDGTALNEVNESSFNGQNYNFFESDRNNVRLHFNTEMLNGVTGQLTIESGSVKVNNTAYTTLYYHGSGNKILEVRGDSTAAIGNNAFADTLVIEEGTRLWLNGQCLEFKEELQWVYVGDGNIRDGSGNNINYDWMINKNTNISISDIVHMEDNMEAGGEVRLKLKDGILSNDFYGFMAVNTNKGVPVVNGVEFSDQSFAYGQGNDLIAVRGGEYGGKLGAYIVIPKGSEWWTTQGKLTFLEEIRCVFVGEWRYGFDTSTNLGSISLANVQRVYNQDDNEVRVMIAAGITDTYYGPIAVDGQVTVEKADGTVSSVSGYWYGGASGTYTANHSLIGFRGTNIAGATEGDVFTLKAGAKIIGYSGYNVFADDVVYTYVDGSWKAGNLNATATYTVNGSATVSGAEKLIIGKTYSFTVTPNSGYAVSEVTVNGNTIALNSDNVYSFTAGESNEIVVSTVSTADRYAVHFVFDNNGVTVDGGKVENGVDIYVEPGDPLTFSVAANSGYRLVGVEGAAANGDGTYTLTPTDNTTVTISTVKVWNVTYTLNNATASIAGVTVTSGSALTVDQGEYVVTVTANSGYAITGVTNATNNLDGTYTVNVNQDMSVVVNTMQAIQFGADVISAINPYDETQHGEGLTGVRFSLNETAYPEFANITNVHYGMSWNGSVTADVDGGVYYATVFGGDHNLFELRFATANLEVGDTFTIEKGTVFYGGGSGGSPYAIEFTERIVGVWLGSQWVLPEKIGDLDFNSNKITSLISYSDYQNGTALNYTVRIILTNGLFSDATAALSVVGNVTINGTAYTGGYYYHGGTHKIIQLSNVDYNAGDILVIEKGTRIYMGAQYYEFTNTLTATCDADGNKANWTYTLS